MIQMEILFHSQIVMVLRELLSEEDLLLWKPVNVYVAPAGIKISNRRSN
jgi:hypothetical protein